MKVLVKMSPLFGGGFCKFGFSLVALSFADVPHCGVQFGGGGIWENNQSAAGDELCTVSEECIRPCCAGVKIALEISPSGAFVKLDEVQAGLREQTQSRPTTRFGESPFGGLKATQKPLKMFDISGEKTPFSSAFVGLVIKSQFWIVREDRLLGA